MMLSAPPGPQSKPPSSSTLKLQFKRTPGLLYERSLKPCKIWILARQQSVKLLKILGSIFAYHERNNLLMVLRRFGKSTGNNTGFSEVRHAGKRESGLMSQELNTLGPINREKKVRMREGEEVLEKHLVPSFQSGRIKVNCWAAISYESKTPLVRVKKRKPSERKTAHDHLGLNSDQYATEIYESHLISFLHSLDRPISRLNVLDDNALYHQAALAAQAANRQVSSAYGIQKLPLLASSPDLNPIENVWHIFKQRLQRRLSKNVNERPHSEDELWAVMEEE